MKHFFDNLKEKLGRAGIGELLHNRKFVLSLVAIVAGFMLTVWLILYFSFSKNTGSTALDAVPPDASVILEIKQPNELWNELSVTSGVWAELMKIETFSAINKEISFLDSLFRTNDCAASMMKDNMVYISIHSMATGNAGFLYLTGLDISCSKSAAEEVIKNAFSPKAAVFDMAFMGTDIKEISIPGRTEKFIYTISKDIFICSSQRMLVESAIKQQKTGISVAKDAGFAKVAETTGKKVIADIYINFKYFPTLISKLSATSYAKRMLELTGIANWSAMDISVKKDAILMNGFTAASDTAGFLGLFTGQEPHEMLMPAVLPASTASFVYYGFSDFDKWYKSYGHYLERKEEFTARDATIAKLNKAYKTDIEKDFTTWIGKEMALVITEPEDADITANMFAVIKADNIKNAMTLLGPQSVVQTQKVTKPKKVVKVIKDKKGKKKTTTTTTAKKVEEVKVTPTEIESNKIYEYQVPGVMPALFGKLFDGVQGTYYTIVNDYVVFANSSKALTSFLKDIDEEKTLENNNAYLAFSKNISTESNIYLYCNIRKSMGIFLKYTNKDIVNYMSSSFGNFKNFDAFAWQVKADNKLFYTNICLKTNTTVVEESSALWALKLDSAVYGRPQVVSDVSDKAKKIIAFDNAANMYLIDKDGSQLWKIELKETPMSEVFVIDYAKDGKSEYMFNTMHYIYLVDKDGKSVGDFPLRLTDAASAPMTVVDYAKTKDYNLIVPCGDKIYNFTKEGEANKNWTIFKALNEIDKEVTYVNESLLTSDREGNVYVLNKNGAEKLKIKTAFVASAFGKFYALKGGNKNKARLLTTDSEGNLAYISSSGAVEKKTIEKFSAGHYFLYEDINNDKSNEYIFLDNDKLSVFDKDLKALCTYTFPVKIAGTPLYFEDAKGNGMLGFVSTKSSKIYLLKSDCSIRAGFPLNGTTAFSVSSLSNDGALNLIIGSERTVFNYSIE